MHLCPPPSEEDRPGAIGDAPLRAIAAGARRRRRLHRARRPGQHPLAPRRNAARAVQRHAPIRVVATEAGEWAADGRHAALARSRRHRSGNPRRHPASSAASPSFAPGRQARPRCAWSSSHREMRRRYGLLMEHGAPVENRWNFDAENRKRLLRGDRRPRHAAFPARRNHAGRHRARASPFRRSFWHDSGL